MLVALATAGCSAPATTTSMPYGRDNPHVFPACPGVQSADHRMHAFNALLVSLTATGTAILEVNPGIARVVAEYRYSEQYNATLSFEADHYGRILVYNARDEYIRRNFVDNIGRWLQYLQSYFGSYSCFDDARRPGRLIAGERRITAACS
jgi:hypothetical protein